MTRPKVQVTKAVVLQVLEQRVRAVGSQHALALAIGCSDQYLSDILRGRRPPGRKVLRALGYELVTERYEVSA
jgi:transcriptional regulator with XRE-family HTH domain